MNYIPPPPKLQQAGLKVWSYLRDSGGDSQEQSVLQQKAEIQTYCARYGLLLAHIFADVAKSGGSVVGRENFLEMVDLTGEAPMRPAGILLWNFARFARDLEDATYHKSLIRRRGIVVHSLTDPIPEGQWGRAIETLIDIANEEKRRQTSQDVTRALHTLARAGYSTGGTPPRGYKAVPVLLGHKRDGRARMASRWEPDPELWEVCKLAWHLRAQGETYGAIQKATGWRIYKSDNCWITFFKNESYLGIGKVGDERLPDHHPPMIDRETWEAVQQVNATHAQARFTPGHLDAPRRMGTPSLLSGLAVCPLCGAAMNYGVKTGPTPETSWPFYLCGTKARQNSAACPARRVGARAADVVIFEAVLARVLTPTFASALIAEMRTHFDNTAALEVQLDNQRRALKDCERAIGNLIDLAERFGADAAGEKLTQREGERRALRAQIATLESQHAAAQVAITSEALEAVFAVWRVELNAAPDDIRAKKMFLTRFVAKVELGYNETKIHYRYSF